MTINLQFPKFLSQPHGIRFIVINPEPDPQPVAAVIDDDVAVGEALGDRAGARRAECEKAAASRFIRHRAASKSATERSDDPGSQECSFDRPHMGEHIADRLSL